MLNERDGEAIAAWLVCLAVWLVILTIIVGILVARCF